MPYVRPGSRMRRGVGMYPDETCFDPARPSWLPNWLDDLTESSCKVNLVVSGNTSGNTAQPGTFTTAPDGTVVSAADPATIANAQAACAAQSGTWDPNLNVCSPNLLTQFVGNYGLYIGLGLAGFLLLSSFMGGRR